MQAVKNRLPMIAAVFAWLFASYLLSYLVWINYTATGNFFSGIFGRHGIHMGMSFVMNPSPGFLQKIYIPLMILDVWCGRLEVNVG